MTIDVLKPGAYSTFQDLGRWGSQHLGVPVSGAMDLLSHRIANRVVGNPGETATLEITLMGPTLVFRRAATIAWCGGDLSPQVDGTALPRATPVRVAAGQTLQFGKRRSGLRAYLAVAGGYAIAPVMGSCSTYVRAGFGGLDGRALVRGDSIALNPEPAEARQPPPGRERFAHIDALLAHADAHALDPIRVVPGRQWDDFAGEGQRTLLSQPFRIGAQSERMGYRLEGPPLARVVKADIQSEPTAFGAIQVPPDGQPIVLMAERQTTGGYPKIAQVASVDLSRLAQRMPGEKVGFALIDVAKAQALLLAQARALAAGSTAGRA